MQEEDSFFGGMNVCIIKPFTIIMYHHLYYYCYDYFIIVIRHHRRHIMLNYYILYATGAPSPRLGVTLRYTARNKAKFKRKLANRATQG